MAQFNLALKIKLAEEKEHHERERFSDILEAIPDGVYIVNNQYDIAYINPVIAEAFGPVNRKKCFQYLHNRKKPCEDCNNIRMFAGKSLHRDWHSNKNRHYEVFDSPLKCTHGGIAKVTFLHDVTREKKVANALKKNQILLNAIINNSSTVIFVKDIKGRYLMANSRFEQLVNKNGTDITGKTDFNLFSADQAQRFQANDREVLDSKLASQFEEIVQHKDGNHVYMSLKFPLFNTDDTIYGIACISTDISKYKQLENDLQTTNRW